MSRNNEIGMSEWRDLVGATVVEDAVPQGFLSVGRALALCGFSSTSSGKKRLDVLVDRGLLDRAMFRIRAGMNIRPVAHYRPANGWRKIVKAALKPVTTAQCSA